MTGAAEAAGSHVYIYGVARTEGGAPPLAIGEGVVPGAPVQLLPVGGLSAIVSVFPAGSALPAGGVSDSDWAKTRALAHHEVLAALAGCFPLAPSKFGTVLRSVADVVELIERNAASLEETLDHVAECREWGLKLFGELGAWRASAEGDPALAPLQDELACASAGKAYFLRKKLRLAVEAEAQRRLVVRAMEIHRQLASTARQSAYLSSSHVLKPARAQDAPVMLLNTAYLVEEVHEAQFHEALAAMRSTFAQTGLSEALTGPWPPYNFVSLSAAGRAHV